MVDDEVRENPDTQPVEDIESHGPSGEAGNKAPSKLMIFGIVVVLIVTGYIVLPDFYKSYKALQIENKAVQTLRWIGSCQLSYQGQNERKLYGVFESLVEKGFISDEYTTGTLIPNYDTEWDTYPRLSDIQDWDVYGGSSGAFYYTVTAYPRSYVKPLRTFGISSDQIVRVYNPENGNPTNGRDDPMIRSWDIYSQ